MSSTVGVDVAVPDGPAGPAGPAGQAPAGDASTDSAVMASCRTLELTRRRTEGELVSALMDVERRKVYLSDGFRCVAAYGRGVHRWDALEARSRRGLTKLSLRDGRVIDRLVAGRIGVAQAHLLGRLFEMPRIGQYVELFLDLFLDWAALLDHADFEEQVRNWRLLVDQDGADPARAHRDRAMRVAMSDHQYRATLDGPAVDGVRLMAVLDRFDQIEWDIDWEQTKAVHGDLARPDLMPRSSIQRRYDAFQNLLEHVQVPARHAPSDLDPDLDPDLESGSATATTDAPAPATGVRTVVNIIADIDTYLAALGRAFGGNDRRPFPVPFGPQRARCNSSDGDAVSPHDLVLASLAGQVRLLLANEEGQVIAMTRLTRFFTGALRDAALATTTRCGHPGCLVATRHLHVDHQRPSSHGGPTAMVNSGGGACAHHNNWRYTAEAVLRRHPDSRLTTHRRDGTDIAPPE